MATEFNINRFKNLPTGGKNGDIQILEKPNNRFETYIVKPDGSKAFSKGITDEQETKINSVTTGDIQKLKEDYTKAEIDQKFNDVRNFANSSRINLNGSTVLPVPPRRPDNTVIEDAWVRLAQNVTYTQAGGDPLTGIDGHETIAEWSNEDGEWVLVDMGELPQTPADAEITLGDYRAASGDKTYRAIAPISAQISGGNILFGDDDFASYTTNNTQEMLFLHRAFPVNVQGNVVSVSGEFHRGGSINIYIARPVEGQPQRFTLWGKTPVTAVVGNNNFETSIETLPGDLIAIGQVAGGALIKTKVGSNGLWLNITTANADVANGTEVGFSGSNRVMALNFNVRIGGLSDEVDAVNSRVDNVEGEIVSAMKESDLTIEPSKNMFDPSKIVIGKYVSNTGSVASNPDFESILINVEDIPDGEDITYSGIDTAKPGQPSYFAFYTTDDPNTFGISTLIAGSNGSFTSNPTTVQKPAGAVGMALNIKRSGNTESVYENAVINLGDTPIPYEPYSGGVITEYKGRKFAGANGGGGEAYDQSLNTTDNVEFNSVTTHALLAELPEGAGSPPSGVLIGQAWIDTTDDSIKVRRS